MGLNILMKKLAPPGTVDDITDDIMVGNLYSLTPCKTIITFYLSYLSIKLPLGVKLVFKHQDLQMYGPKLNI